MTLRLDTPIFVGGAGSTGSTLLATLLRRHPDIFCPSELAIFNKAVVFSDIATWRDKLPRWIKSGVPTDGYYPYFPLLPKEDVLTADVLIQIANESRDTRQFIDSIQTYCLQESGKTQFAEKTPSNSYCFPQLVSLYPDCLLIHPVRDGRDVVCSLMRRGFSIFAAASAWLYNAACAFRCRHLPNYFEYKYEDLVQDPTAVLRRICERASLDPDPQMLENPKDERERKYTFRGVWNSDPTQPISQKSVGRYQKDLSDADYDVFCRVRLTDAAARRAGIEPYSASELLQLLGYPVESTRKRPAWVKSRILEARDQLRRTRLFVLRNHLPPRPLTRIE